MLITLSKNKSCASICDKTLHQENVTIFKGKVHKNFDVAQDNGK